MKSGRLTSSSAADTLDLYGTSAAKEANDVLLSVSSSVLLSLKSVSVFASEVTNLDCDGHQPSSDSDYGGCQPSSDSTSSKCLKTTTSSLSAKTTWSSPNLIVWLFCKIAGGGP